MTPNTPVDALGPHYDTARDVVVEVVRTRTERMVDAHQVSGTRNTSLFGTQWRDLLTDSRVALTSRGFRSHKLPPAGYELPVVNDCLIYVWRVSDDTDAVKNFASSPTRLNGFATPPPPMSLFDGTVIDVVEPVVEVGESQEALAMRNAAQEHMPLVLVMIWSTPRGLSGIEWGVATLNSESKVVLHGQESIWSPELVTASVDTDVESFDSGVPAKPMVSLQTQSRPTDG
ncbi:hypothetical protein ACFQ8T_06630 [Isoptericola sp. NPDC056618]|uniref:hypothetical protein n=1 Tax=Isoptericola sp. NPDC056618 TaxID=3345878 RepID=UPI00368BE0FC